MGALDRFENVEDEEGRSHVIALNRDLLLVGNASAGDTVQNSELRFPKTDASQHAKRTSDVYDAAAWSVTESLVRQSSGQAAVHTLQNFWKGQREWMRIMCRDDVREIHKITRAA